MRVMCITDGWNTVVGSQNSKNPSYSEICNVKKTLNDELGLMYNLYEYEFDGIAICWYRCDGFIPLSDIDETELINQKIEHESRINH